MNRRPPSSTPFPYPPLSRSLESLRDSAGRDVPVLRLEPLLICSIFPIHGEDRIVVTPQEVPTLLPAALKAVEDRKFDSHHGVDPIAMLRALWVDGRARQIEPGGRTLPQPLVRSYFLSSRQTLSRKVREAIMAMALDAHFTKADLMNAYINEIFLGQDGDRSEEHTSELQSQSNLVCRLLLEKKKKKQMSTNLTPDA